MPDGHKYVAIYAEVAKRRTLAGVRSFDRGPPDMRKDQSTHAVFSGSLGHVINKWPFLEPVVDRSRRLVSDQPASVRAVR